MARRPAELLAGTLCADAAVAAEGVVGVAFAPTFGGFLCGPGLSRQKHGRINCRAVKRKPLYHRLPNQCPRGRVWRSELQVSWCDRWSEIRCDVRQIGVWGRDQYVIWRSRAVADAGARLSNA